jgi:TatD DNase family protein
MRLFDTHAHYDSSAFNADREAVLASMPEQGVELILNPGCEIESSKTAVALAEKFPYVYAAVGVHPSDCGDWTEDTLAQLRALAGHPRVKAIGEIGLDYYWKENPPALFQQKVFHAQLDLAEELSLPVIVHDREAHRDCLEVVKAHPNVTGVYHCYSGSLEDAKILVKLGWMLSFTGVVTYKNARKALEVLEWLPMERIMIETDSPYLTPEPFRGKRNDSGHVHLVAETIARVKGLEPEEVARVTLENGKRFFHIDAGKEAIL